MPNPFCIRQNVNCKGVSEYNAKPYQTTKLIIKALKIIDLHNNYIIGQGIDRQSLILIFDTGNGIQLWLTCYFS